MIKVTKIFMFEACHHLPYYEGACHRLHGHSYKLEVTVGGGIETDNSKSNYGMVIDFKDLKKIVKEVIDKYDHSNLNDFFDNPTAELMVRHIAVEITSKLPKGVFLVSCKLWETNSSYAEFDALEEQTLNRFGKSLLKPAT